jgi:KDO2-lipid IV(A) lauroyltransferase
MKKLESWLTRLVYIFFKGLSLWPLPLLYFLSDVVIYPLVYYVVRYRRSVAAENLKNSFPSWSEHQLKGDFTGIFAIALWKPSIF